MWPRATLSGVAGDVNTAASGDAGNEAVEGWASVQFPDFGFGASTTAGQGEFGQGELDATGGRSTERQFGQPVWLVPAVANGSQRPQAGGASGGDSGESRSRPGSVA